MSHYRYPNIEAEGKHMRRAFTYSNWWGFGPNRKIVERVMQRKRALETMLATLTEDVP